MANTCNNEIHITTSPKDVEYIKNYMEETFPNINLIYERDDAVEFVFESEWAFPLPEMITLFDNSKDKENFKATCLSVEWGERYAEFWDCDENGWA